MTVMSLCGLYFLWLQHGDLNKTTIKLDNVHQVSGYGTGTGSEYLAVGRK